MSHKITDETIEQVGILAKLEMSEEDRVQAQKDMEEMLAYIDKLNELDTDSVEPMSHIFRRNNVFREDPPEGKMTEADGCEAALSNAPYREGGTFVVPQTIAGQPGGVS